MSLRWQHALVPAALFSLACSASIASKLSLNGQAYTPTDCRNGAVYGFSGVELTADDDMRLRIESTGPSGGATVHVFPPGALGAAATIPNCGSITTALQSSEINGVKNVQGEAQLSCSDGAYTIAGDVTFENCH